MVKLTALYKQPEDVQAFEEHYRKVHLPLASKMPGLQKVELSHFSKTPTGDNPPYFMQCDLYFTDNESLDRAMQSPEGKEAAKDIWKLASKIMTMIVAEVETVTASECTATSL